MNCPWPTTNQQTSQLAMMTVMMFTIVLVVQPLNICNMLKHRYKDIRRCSSTTRNALSIEICILQAMKIKDKSNIPGYLQYRDKGYTCIFHRAV